jgi:hypothetical protein
MHTHTHKHTHTHTHTYIYIYISRRPKFGFHGYLSPGICVPLLNGNSRATENREKFSANIFGFYWLAKGSELNRF